MMCLTANRLGWRTAVVGIACDHGSGQTANKESGWHNFAQEWCEERNIPMINNWDNTVYKKAEEIFLTELRKENIGGFNAIRIQEDYSKQFI